MKTEAETGVMQPPRMPRAIRSTRRGKDGPLEPSEEVKPQWHLDFRLWLLELCENKLSWFWVPKFMVICYSGPGNLHSSQSCSLVPEHFCSICIPQSLLLLLSLLDYLQTPTAASSWPPCLQPCPLQAKTTTSARCEDEDFPGSPVVENLDACQGRRHSFNSWSRKIPYAMGPLSWWATTMEPVSHNYWACLRQLLKLKHLEPVLCNKRSHCGEKPAHHSEE